MVMIKSPKLDICDFYKKSKTVNNQPIPSPKPDMLITVRQNGMGISVIVGAIPDGGGDLFVGKIVELHAMPDKYNDLNVGDKIKFVKENISLIT
ncbi:hypothetical protein ACFLZT_05665 [Thermodesulfobacteriota bacterium]